VQRGDADARRGCGRRAGGAADAEPEGLKNAFAGLQMGAGSAGAAAAALRVEGSGWMGTPAALQGERRRGSPGVRRAWKGLGGCKPGFRSAAEGGSEQPPAFRSM